MRIHLALVVLLTAVGFRSAGTATPIPAHLSDDLPDGEGKKILEASCTVCHDLTEVTKFKGYYTRDDWRDIVNTMIEYGAKVDARQADVLVDYLTVNLGKK
jgi:cytochrome c5